MRARHTNNSEGETLVFPPTGVATNAELVQQAREEERRPGGGS